MIRHMLTSFLVLTTSLHLLNAAELKSDLSLGIQSQNFSNANIDQQMNNSFDLSIVDERKFSKGKTKVEAHSQYFQEKSHLAYSLSELYYTHQFDRVIEVGVGRKRLDWSADEGFWYLSNINGAVGINFLDERQEGKFGVHSRFQSENKKFHTELFASYFYVPSLNPRIDEEDGKIVRKSYWGRTPPSTVVVEGNQLDINYNVERPDVSDVVFKKSFGAKIGYDWTNVSVSAFGLYKPENQLRINAQAFPDTSARIQATAAPIVNHHSVFGADLSVHTKDKKVVVKNSFQVIDPNSNVFDDFVILDPIEQERTGRIFETEYIKINPNYEKQSYWFFDLKLPVAKRQSATIKTIAMLEGDKNFGDDFLTFAPLWRRGIGTEYQNQVLPKVSFRVKYLYDLRLKDQLISADSRYLWSKDSFFSFGAKLLRSPDTRSYWYDYRANDLFSFGYTKIF
ncbi:MAG: hypothetical protein ACPGJV_02160 [Bacteriovoracaceae bacterium]